MKDVYVGNDDFTAQIIKSKLDDAGIESCILNENINNILPYASVMISMSIRVVVSDQDYDLARDVVGDVNEDGERRECPFCGSSDIELGLNGKAKLSKLITMIFAALTFNPVGHLRCGYYCKACKSEF